MKALNLKKLGLWLVVLLLALSATSFGVMYYQVNKAWGEYVPVVDPALYAKTQSAYAITNANVLSDNGQYMLPNQTVLIQEGKITKVGSDLSLPEDAQVIDGTGKFIIPGLIDAHVHFVACALGQAAGSPIIGLLVGEFGYAESFSIFAAVGVLIALISPFYPGHTEHEGDIPEEETGLQAAFDNQLQDEEGEPLESNSTEQ